MSKIVDLFGKFFNATDPDQKQSLKAELSKEISADELSQAIEQLQAFQKLKNDQQKLTERLLLEQKRSEGYRATLRAAGAEIERRNRSVRLLTSFMYQTTQMTEVPALLKFALTQVVETTGSEMVAIILIDQESRELSMGAHTGLSPRFLRILTGRQFDEGAVQLMPYLVSGKAALLEAGHIGDEAEKLLMEEAGVTALLSLPLQTWQGLLGAMIVGVKAEKKVPPSDLHFLIALSQELAVAVEGLSLREKLWHIASSLLERPHADQLATTMATLTTPTSLTPLQKKLGGLIGDVGATMGAVFVIDPSHQGGIVKIVADYGLSPIFGNLYAHTEFGQKVFPFEELINTNIVINDIGQYNNKEQYPLLTHLQEEGATSCLWVCLSETGKRPLEILMVASTGTYQLNAKNLEPIVRAGESLLRSLHEDETVQTLLSAMNQQAPVMAPEMNAVGLGEMVDDDLEQLLAAMMAAEEEVERHNSDLTAMNNISELLSRSLQVDKVFPEVLTRIYDILGVDACWLYIVDDVLALQTQFLILKSEFGLSENYVRGMHQITVGDGLEGFSAKNDQALFINDVEEDRVRCHLLADQEGMKSVAVLPLGCPDDDPNIKERWVVGVLVVAQRSQRNWELREQRFLSTVSNQMALAVNNSQQMAQLQDALAMVSGNNQMLQQINKDLMRSQTELKQKLIEIQQSLG